MSKKTFSKLAIGDRLIKAQIQWVFNEEHVFIIQLFEGNNTWKGTFSKESSEYYREELDLTEEKYQAEVQRALEGSSKDFEYSLDSEKNVSIFKWKNIFTYNNKPGVRIHGKVILDKGEVLANTTEDSLLDNLMKENRELRESNESYKIQNSQLNAELEKYKKLLEDYLQNEKNLESMLYSKFVQVLNEKKKRIQMLEEHINAFES